MTHELLKAGTSLFGWRSSPAPGGGGSRGLIVDCRKVALLESKYKKARIADPGLLSSPN